MAKIYSSSELREFRKQVKVLRDKGIIGPTDSRQAMPYWVRGGRPLKELVRDFRGVIEGTQEVIPAGKVSSATRRVESSKVLTNLKTGKRERFVVVNTPAGESVTVDKQGNIHKSNPKAGIETVVIPVPEHGFEKWFKSTQAEAYLKQGAKDWGFRFGIENIVGYSHLYANINQLWDELNHYKAVIEALDGSPYQQREIMRNFVLYRIYDTGEWKKLRAEHSKSKNSAVKSEYKGKTKKARRRKK